MTWHRRQKLCSWKFLQMSEMQTLAASQSGNCRIFLLFRFYVKSNCGKSWNSLPHTFFSVKSIYTKVLMQNVDLTEFLWKNWGSKISKFPQCGSENLFFCTNSFWVEKQKKINKSTWIGVLFFLCRNSTKSWNKRELE